MRDPRTIKLAKLLINHSCALTKGEKVLIESVGAPNEAVIALIQEATDAGGTPFVRIKDDQVIRKLNMFYDKKDFKLMADFELCILKQMDAFIAVRGFSNIRELSDIPKEKLKLVLEHYIQPVHLRYRNQKTRWVAIRWPTPAMAQRAGMSTEAFENYFFEACMVDYAKMELAMGPLAELMLRTDKVKIIGPGDTDISFSIKGMPCCKYAGQHNIPDGELFTAPIRESVNGRIHYNVPSAYYGTVFNDVCFDFKAGKIINALSDHPNRINSILNQDEGARYIGEFAFGFNPMIDKPMKDGLFDEKMWGTIHLTLGNAYRECDNGNRSSIHWDLILDQRPELGGGKIYFDGILIRENGRFIQEELQGLNPENISIY